MKIRCYGYSDDVALCQKYKDDGTELSYTDADCYDKTAILRVMSGDKGCYIAFRYAPNNLFGSWVIGMSQLDEDIDLPEWAMHPTFTNDEYTTIMELTVPDDVTFKWMGVEGDDE